MPSEVTNGLIKRLVQRDETGLRKYGVSLDRPDLTIEQWLEHLTRSCSTAPGTPSLPFARSRRCAPKFSGFETRMLPCANGLRGRWKASL